MPNAAAVGFEPNDSGVVVVMSVTEGAVALLLCASTKAVIVAPWRRAAMRCHWPSVTFTATLTAAPCALLPSGYISNDTPLVPERMPQKLHAEPHERLPRSSEGAVCVERIQ